MIDWNFENSQTESRGFHLHFQIPAVGFFFHRQLLERIALDRAKRAHVGVTHAVQDRHQPSGEAAGKDLLKIHATRFTLAARARTNHEIVIPSSNWIDKLLHEFRTIASIAIEK